MYVNLISGYLKRVLVFALDTIVGRVLLKTLSADALQHCSIAIYLKALIRHLVSQCFVNVNSSMLQWGMALHIQCVIFGEMGAGLLHKVDCCRLTSVSLLKTPFIPILIINFLDKKKC